MIWRLECLCDNVARFVGRGVIDVCERKGEKFRGGGGGGGVMMCVCSMIQTHSGIREWISEYCVVECVGVLSSADLCQFPLMGFQDLPINSPLNRGNSSAGTDVQTVLPPKRADRPLWAGSPFAWPSLAPTARYPPSPCAPPSPPGRR